MSSASGGLSVASREGAPPPPTGTEEHRFTIADHGSVTLRGVGDDDVTWTFTAIPDRAPTIALTKDPEPQARGALLLDYKIEDDYGVIEAKALFARKDAKESRRARSTARPTWRWCCRRRAPAAASGRPRRI